MIILPDDTHWAVTEFADAELGDGRRTTRLVELAYALGQHPTAALPEACGDGAMRKAAYRFFANDAVEPQDVLLSHIEAGDIAGLRKNARDIFGQIFVYFEL